MARWCSGSPIPSNILYILYSNSIIIIVVLLQLDPVPFTWHVYSISAHYASLTAYIRVHRALSQTHSVTWQAELKPCQHIHPGRDTFQQLTDHFVTVTEGQARILSPPTSHHSDTHRAASCDTPARTYKVCIRAHNNIIATD